MNNLEQKILNILQESGVQSFQVQRDLLLGIKAATPESLSSILWAFLAALELRDQRDRFKDKKMKSAISHLQKAALELDNSKNYSTKNKNE